MISVKQNLRPTVAEIDLAALKKNLTKLRALAGDDVFFCPMIKANGYGHGAVELAKFLINEGVEHLGVSLIEEAIEIRNAGVKTAVLVFGSFNDISSAQACIDYRLTPVISTRSQLNVLEQVAADKDLEFHLKFDTGMNRLGFSPQFASQLRTHIAKFQKWNLKGVCTHLLRGDDASTAAGFSLKQLQSFKVVTDAFEGLNISFHALNSSGLVHLDPKHKISSLGARPGIALYGGYPGFDQVMTLKSKIISTREVEAGHSVSYNATWTAKRKSLIGVVPIGYADGVFRKLSNNFHVLCCERRIPAVGTVNMDYVLVDLTDLKDQLSSLGEGEEVVFFGRQGRAEISALEWAKILDTITYEIFTSISNRVPRVYVGT